MINNEYDGMRSPSKRPRPAEALGFDHRLLSLREKHTFNGATEVKCKTRYIQLICNCERKRRVRAYCSCSPGVMRCTDCYHEHLLEVVN